MKNKLYNFLKKLKVKIIESYIKVIYVVIRRCD